MPPPLRIFVSSPGDVREERLRAQLIIAKLARDYAGLVDVQPYFWESEPLRASGHFQDEIELPSQHDIVVLILWSRLGTPLPVRTSVREYVGMDGRTPVTGTEWEFEDALAAFQLRNTPDLLVYRRSGDPGTSLTDAALRAEQERQWQALQEFWARHFENRGEFLAASARYDSLEAFDERLEADLAKLIERRLAAGFNGAPAAHLKGPPYRGLSTYDFADAPVFFGRDGAIRSGLLRLSKAAETGCGCLVVLGASGSGKSSLARAGLVPALVAAKAVPGVGLWRRVVVRPGDAGADPIAALAGALLSGNAARGEGLAELGGPGTGAAELTRHLRASTDDASYPFRTALGALAEHERSIKALLTHEEARLVLLVDQLEELFTRPDITENDRLAFVRLLAGLARSGVVWVIATMRSDLWHRAAAIPELLRLTEDGARLDLLPPDAAELLEVIRRPARATGLGFEEEARIGLDAVLAEAAAAEPGALPLLSVVLEDLYRHDVVDNSGRSLTFAGYRAMGELKGAIATRAELAWTGLDARDSQAAAALPEVLRTLVTSSTGEAVTSRPSHLDAFAEASPARRLIEALLAPDIRLLTVEGDNRQTSLRLSHEALIEHWPRAQAQIQADRRDIETRSRLESLLRAYEATPMGREKGRALLTGLSLEEGRDLAARWRLSGNEPLGRFIAASARADRLRRNALLTTAAALVAIFAGLAGLAALQWREAEQQRSVALTNEHRAEVSSRLAEEGRAEALRRRVEADAARVRAEEARAGAEAARGAAEQERRAAEAANARAAASQREQSRILAASAQTELDKGNVAIGRTTALRALSEEGTLSAQPIAEGRLALMRAMHLDRFIDRVRLPAGSPVSFAFAQDGSRLVVGNGGREALVYDLDNRKLVHRLPTFNDVATSVDVAPNGRSVLVAGDRRPRVYDLATGALQWQAPPSPTGKSFSWSGRFGPNGRTAIIGWSDNHAQAFEIASGKVVWDFEGAKFTDAPPTGKGTGLDPLMAAVQKAQWRTFGSVQYLSSSSDGRLLAVTSQGDPLRAATVLEAETGRRIATFNVSNENNLIGVDDAVFSPDNQLLAASRQENLAVFDISSGSQLWQFTQPGILNALAFDPGGRHLATGWSDTSVRVWDPRTGAFVTEILGDRAAITSLTFSRDGSRLAIGYASGAVALVETAGWTGSALIRAHGSEVKTLAFTPDGAQLVTGGRDGTIGFWSAWSKFTQPFEAPRWHNLLSLTGERLFASTADGSVLGIWSTTDGKQLNSIALGGIAKSLLRTVDGHFVVAVHKHALNGRALTVLDETGRRIGFVQLPADVDVKQVAVDAPQGLAAVSDGDDSWVFGLRSKSMPRKFAGSLPVFTGSGRLTLLVTPSEGNPQTAGILPARARDGRPRLVTMRLSDGGIFSTFPASCLRYQLGQNVGLVENAEGVVVGDLETGRIKAKLEGRLPRMLGDGRTVLTVSGGSLLVQDATKAVQPTRRTLPKHLGEVLHLEASNDGSRALVFGTTGNALIDPNSGAVIAAWGETSLDKVHVRPDLPDCQPDGKVFRPSWRRQTSIRHNRSGRAADPQRRRRPARELARRVRSPGVGRGWPDQRGDSRVGGLRFDYGFVLAE
jgi:WD40 repeat protein